MLILRVVVLCLTLCVVLKCQSQVLAANPRAEAAEAAYKKAIDDARNIYIGELDAAIKEEGADGNLEEANKLADMKESLLLEAKLGDSDPAFVTSKRLENTRWGTRANPKGFIKFLSNNKTQNHLKTGGVWIASDESTVITQSRNSGHIYLFQFSKDLKTATVHRFENAKQPEAYFRK